MGVLYGGGFSWYTNQHGLAVDNVVAFNLVLPNGTYANVTEKSQPDLYFGLRGGSNNFGIVTGVTLKTWPSGGIWASFLVFIDGSDAKMLVGRDY
jgi:FAD/FMN-containing dehydrogenase